MRSPSNGWIWATGVAGIGALARSRPQALDQACRSGRVAFLGRADEVDIDVARRPPGALLAGAHTWQVIGLAAAGPRGCARSPGIERRGGVALRDRCLAPHQPGIDEVAGYVGEGWVLG